MAKVDPTLFQLALNKAILDAFAYFNTNCPDNLLKLLISDIKEVYYRNSPVEIIEGIKQGRKTQDVSVIYGKLSAAHIMEWLRFYNEQITNKITSDFLYKQEKVKNEVESSMHDDNGEFIIKNKLSIKPKEKKEFSKTEKNKEFEYQLNYSKEQRDRIDYGRKWFDLPQPKIRYEEYMNDYDLKNGK